MNHQNYLLLLLVEAKGNPQGKACFLLGVPWLSGGQKPTIFRTFTSQAELLYNTQS